MRLRFDLLGDGRRVLGTIGNKSGAAPAPMLVPDVKIDFATGAGIPAAIGGTGDWGAELVQITSPQSGTGFYRRRLEAYDPSWQGYPLFELKPADRLVGWAGPRTNGYWTGPMLGLSSTSETVAVYSSTTGLTVTPVAGGVVGPDAIRCDIGAGESGGWGVMPVPAMASGWSAGTNNTILYAHAVIEVSGDLGAFEPWLGLRDEGAGAFIETVAQALNNADGPRAGKIDRGIGPHGGRLFEWWAIARLLTTPVGPISGLLYLLNAPASSGYPARSMVIHGAQVYFISRWATYPIYSVPPFFSYARGASVAWTAEELRVTSVDGANSVALHVATPAFAGEISHQYTGLFARNNNVNERWMHIYVDHLQASSPAPGRIEGFLGKAVLRCASDYHRHATVDGATVVDHGLFNPPAPSPSFLGLGEGDGKWFGRMYKMLIWRRALSDAEMLEAFGQL